MKKLLPCFLAATVLAVSCGPLTDSWTLEVSEHDPMKTSFTQKWYTDAVTVFYFVNAVKWEDALTLAYNGDWKTAVDTWMTILEGDISLEKRRCAEYNIALGCYLMGEWKVAAQWIDQSIADYGGGSVPSFVSRLKEVNGIKMKKYLLPEE